LASRVVSGEETSEPRPTLCGDVAIVTVSGELDLALCIKLAPELNAAVRSAARAVVIDLEDVSMVDSSGLALLLSTFRRLDHAGRELAIACPMGSPRRAFEMTALDRQLPMYETRRDALAAIGVS
jgi:anti-sigma B factor antagonist